MLPTKFRFIWPNGFRGEEFKKSTNQKKKSPIFGTFLTLSLKLMQWYVTSVCRVASMGGPL
jgi:hypothetical protein